MAAWTDGENTEEPGGVAQLVAELRAVKIELRALGRENPRATKLILSFREAAKSLGIGRDTLRILIRAGEVRTVQVNGRTRIPRLEVERLASEGFSVCMKEPRLARRPAKTSDADPQEAILALPF
jgi:excisionase family DNA binding protein